MSMGELIKKNILDLFYKIYLDVNCNNILIRGDLYDFVNNLNYNWFCSAY